MIGVKDETINLNSVCTPLLMSLTTFDAIVSEYGVDTIITSANDGKHGYGSLHYIGHAVDLRIWGIQDKLNDIKAKFLACYPNKQFDFVIESNHIHLEFQPKQIL